MSLTQTRSRDISPRRWPGNRRSSTSSPGDTNTRTTTWKAKSGHRRPGQPIRSTITCFCRKHTSTGCETLERILPLRRRVDWAPAGGTGYCGRTSWDSKWAVRPRKAASSAPRCTRELLDSATSRVSYRSHPDNQGGLMSRSPPVARLTTTPITDRAPKVCP